MSRKTFIFFNATIYCRGAEHKLKFIKLACFRYSSVKIVYTYDSMVAVFKPGTFKTTFLTFLFMLLYERSFFSLYFHVEVLRKIMYVC